MTNQVVPTDGLIVGRAEMAHALGIVSHLMGRRVTGASLRFEDGWLFIGAGNTAAKAPAQGVWPLTIVVGSSWVRRRAKSIPRGDPVFLHVEDGRLYANKYSEPCEWSTQENPLRPSVGKVEEERRILEAAIILKPFLVDREDLRSLVAMTRNRGTASWREQEQTMISAVSKAWSILAPLGVETSDLRGLVYGAVRNAWKGKRGK